MTKCKIGGSSKQYAKFELPSFAVADVWDLDPEITHSSKLFPIHVLLISETAPASEAF